MVLSQDQNVMEGYGVLQDSNGDVLVGFRNNGKRNGRGSNRRSNGNVYEGEFVNDLKKVFGIQKWGSSGSRYVG